MTYNRWSWNYRWGRVRGQGPTDKKSSDIFICILVQLSLQMGSNGLLQENYCFQGYRGRGPTFSRRGPILPGGGGRGQLLIPMEIYRTLDFPVWSRPPLPPHTDLRMTLSPHRTTHNISQLQQIRLRWACTTRNCTDIKFWRTTPKKGGCFENVKNLAGLCSWTDSLWKLRR